jgi:tRNA threonylcarbamoyladenosine biosynthesis protein TsaE
MPPLAGLEFLEGCYRWLRFAPPPVMHNAAPCGAKKTWDNDFSNMLSLTGQNFNSPRTHTNKDFIRSSKMETVINVSNLSETEQVGKILAENLPDGSVVALIGTLGAGKTRLVQAIAECSGVESGVVASPTFVLLHEYEGSRPIYHFDAYRLATEQEFRLLAPDDYFEGNGLTFIEWADKFPNVLPQNYLEIKINIVNDSARQFVFVPHGGQFNDLVGMFRVQK